MSFVGNSLRTRNWKALEHQLALPSSESLMEGIVLRFMYQDVANKVLTPLRTLKYQKWVEEAEKARKTDSLNAKKNQYDKAEELITFYTFAPLELSPREVRTSIIREILDLVDIDEATKTMELYLEKDLRAPDNYMEWLSEEAKKHPIRYIRKQAETGYTGQSPQPGPGSNFEYHGYLK